MEYKITSIYPQAYIEVINELICMDKDFRYDAQEQAIFTDLSSQDIQAFENIQCVCVRNEPTQEEVDSLYEEVVDILKSVDEEYIDLSEHIYATAEQESYDSFTTHITEVLVDGVSLDYGGCDEIIFNYGNDYISASYFRLADQAKVFEQVIKEHNEKKQTNEQE